MHPKLDFVQAEVEEERILDLKPVFTSTGMSESNPCTKITD